MKKKNAKHYILGKDSSFVAKEDYRILQTNISFSIPDDSAKVIGMTSANQGEGKSTNAINLAISFSNAMKKTVLIDCDMRIPSVASKLSLSNESGLSSLLSFETLEDTNGIKKFNSYMDVIPSGVIPPDPMRLLQSERMKKLIEELKTKYEIIILDLPPTNVVADALSLSNMIDGYVIVVCYGITKKGDISECIQALKMVKADILGFIYVNVPNDIKKKYKYYRKAKEKK